MKAFADFLSQVGSTEELKKSMQSVQGFADFTAAASKQGFSISKNDIAEFFGMQAVAISANVAGVDGNGALVFGRDWAYPGPDIDGDVVA